LGEIAKGQLPQCRFTIAEMIAAKGGELQLGAAQASLSTWATSSIDGQTMTILHPRE